MVCAKLTVILLYILVGGMLLFSPYKRIVISASLVILVYMCLKMLVFKMYRNIPKVSKGYVRGKIKPGDLLFTFNVKERTAFSIYNIAHVASNEDLVHSLYAIEYNGQPYVFNTYTAELFEKRKKYFKEVDSLILLADNGGVSGRLEPLDEFLNAESGTNSFVRVVKTRKKVEAFNDSDREFLEKLVSISPIHCCMAVGKYLERNRLLSNVSAYSDFLYYTPDVLRKKLEPTSDRVYQLN